MEVVGFENWLKSLNSTLESGVEYVNLTGENLQYFYVLLKSRKTSKLVIWINGDNQCSGFYCFYLDMGSSKLSTRVDNSLTSRADVLFIDQPGASIFTTRLDSKNNQDSTGAFLNFIQKPRIHSMLSRYDQVYLVGQGYDAKYTIKYSKLLLDLKYNLQGILIGNGIFDLYSQQYSLPSFARIRMGNFITSSRILSVLEKYENLCHLKQASCLDFGKEFLRVIRKENSQGFCPNIKNIILSDKDCGENWPHEMTSFYESTKNNTEILRLLSLNENLLKPCSFEHRNSSMTRSQDFSVEQLIELKVPVYLYASENDMIANYVGIENVLNFTLDRKKADWILEGEYSGYSISLANMNYFLIFNASHETWFDQYDKVFDIFLRTIGEPSENSQLLFPSDILNSTGTVYVLLVILIICAAVFTFFFLREFENSGSGYFRTSQQRYHQIRNNSNPILQRKYSSQFISDQDYTAIELHAVRKSVSPERRSKRLNPNLE